jgi:hypothetical protein
MALWDLAFAIHTPSCLCRELTVTGYGARRPCRSEEAITMVPGVAYRIEFAIDAGADVTVTMSAGHASRFVSRRSFEELVAHPRFLPGMAVLFDNTVLDTSTLTTLDIRAIAEDAQRFRDRFGPLAILAPQPETFGLGRMLEAYTEPSLNFRTFYARAEALEWLQAERSSATASSSAS